VVEVECNFVEDLDKDILERELNSWSRRSAYDDKHNDAQFLVQDKVWSVQELSLLESSSTDTETTWLRYKETSLKASD
jgi:hypothetical protein